MPPVVRRRQLAPSVLLLAALALSVRPAAAAAPPARLGTTRPRSRPRPRVRPPAPRTRANWRATAQQRGATRRHDAAVRQRALAGPRRRWSSATTGAASPSVQSSWPPACGSTGVLDEPIYDCIRAISGFVQLMPDEGAPATEKTEAWIAFDAANIYVSARLWDSTPPAGWVANEMRRDTRQLRNNDSFWVAFDTFHDRRNGVAFYTNPLGALGDFAITNEGNPNGDWNPVWDVRTGRFEGGLDGRDGDPVQVAALPARAGAGMGSSAPPQHPAQERDGLHHAAADLGGADGYLPRLAGSHARGPRGAGRRQQPGDQAVRHRRRDHRPGGHAAAAQRRGGRRRPWTSSTA